MGQRAEEIRLRANGVPLFVYGPEDCGRLCLFRETVRQFKGTQAAGPYVNTLAERMEEVFDFISAELVEFLVKGPRFPLPLSSLGDVVGKPAARAYVYLADWPAVCGACHIFVAVDEAVKSLGLDSAARVAKWARMLMDSSVRDRLKDKR